MRWYRRAKSISYVESLRGGWPEGTVRSKYGGEQQVLTRIPLDRLGQTPGNLMHADRVREYVKNPPSGFPEVIRDGGGLVVEDGNHRIEAARLRGESDILAWLGDRPPWEGGDPLKKYDPDDAEAMGKNKRRLAERPWGADTNHTRYRGYDMKWYSDMRKRAAIPEKYRTPGYWDKSWEGEPGIEFDAPEEERIGREFGDEKPAKDYGARDREYLASVYRKWQEAVSRRMGLEGMPDRAAQYEEALEEEKALRDILGGHDSGLVDSAMEMTYSPYEPVDGDNYVDAAAGLYWFAVQNHEGQFSDLYSIQGELGYRPGRSENGPDDSAMPFYLALESREVSPRDLLDAINVASEKNED